MLAGWIIDQVWGGRGRSWVAITAATTLFAMCAIVTQSMWEPHQDGAERATVLTLPVGLLGLILSVVATWRAWRPVQNVRGAARQLVGAVCRDRQRFLDQALGVRYTTQPATVRFADPESNGFSTAAQSLLIKWQDLDGRLVGSLDDLAEVYAQQDHGRLVVLGDPGSGKTVLLSRLVLDLAAQIEVPTHGDLPKSLRIPVMMSLPTCDLGAVSGQPADHIARQFNDWVTRRLVEDYRLLPSQAATLVLGGHVLPVLDGLDEMDPTRPMVNSNAASPRAAAILTALNADRAMPVVLACRIQQYHGLVVLNEAPPVVVDARHVTVRPLDPQDIIAYLTHRFGGRSGRLPFRWTSVAEAIETNDHLREVLANPWQLFLATTAYADERTTPASLIDLTDPLAFNNSSCKSADAPGATSRRIRPIEEHLLAEYIPAIVEQDDPMTRRWTAEQVRTWLAVIAQEQARAAQGRARSLTDIHLPDLWRLGHRWHARAIPSVVSALIPLLFALSALQVDSSTRNELVGRRIVCLVWLGVAVAWFRRTYRPSGELTRIDFTSLRTRRGKRRLLNGLAVGLVVGLVVGLIGLVGQMLSFWAGIWDSRRACARIQGRAVGRLGSWAVVGAGQCPDS